MKSYISIIIIMLFSQNSLVFSQTARDTVNTLLIESEYWRADKNQKLWREKGIAVNENILDLNCRKQLLTDSTKALIFFRLSLGYDELGYRQQAYFYSQSSLESAKNYYGIKNVANIRYLNRLALTLDNHFDEIESSLQIRKEIEKISKSVPIKSISEELKYIIQENLIRLANEYVKLGDEVKFKEAYAQIDELINSGLFTHFFIPFEYALFKSYGYLSFNKAEEAYQIIYPEYEKQDRLFKATQSNVNEILIIQTVLSEVYIGLDKPEKALELYTKSSKIQNQWAKEALLYEAYIAHVGAQSITALGRYKESKEILKSVVLKLEKVRSENKESFNTDLSELYDQLAQNGYLAYREHQDLSLLYEAYNYSLQAQYYLKASWRVLKNQNDLQYSLHDNYSVFETSLLNLHDLYQQTDSIHYFEEALRLVELTKNVDLRASLNQEKVAKEYGISTHLLVRERAFKKQLFDLKYQVDYSKSESTKQLLQDSIHKVNASFLKLQETIHRQYPGYRHKMQVPQDFNWSELTAYLRKRNQTLLYYTSGEEHLFLLGMSPTGYVFSQIKMSRDSVQILVNTLRKSIYSSPSQITDDQLSELKDLSCQFYEMLIKPIQSMASDRLLIIPDGPLEELPYAMLLSKRPLSGQVYNTWPFIIRQYSFSYAYAIDLLLNPAPKIAEYSEEKILAFAPDFSVSLLRGNNLRDEGQLMDNKQEVAYIEDRFSSTAFYGEQAKLSTFRDLAPDYAVLHLATHAAVDTEIGGYSYLAFSSTDTFDNHLNVGELYTMNIPAELVVLSACETGLGEWQRGEGVIGLERAFSYAGARSVVTTHWKVSDRASASLMGYFYDELADGLPKDKALQKAQVAFINKQDSWLAHPFFWAAYVQKGDTKPLGIPLKSRSWIWYLLGLILTGSIIIFARKK